VPITYSDGGTNRAITSITYGDAGTNRTIREIWYGDGGTNRLVFAAINLLGLDPTIAGPAPGPNNAVYTLTSAGSEQATGVSSNTWLISGVGADYDVMMTLNSGTSPTGSALATWLNLGSNRSWTVSRGALIGINTANTTVQIRSATSLVVLATATVVFTAETT
jgi:hypothetical protein